jgi:hypothetical protein
MRSNVFMNGLLLVFVYPTFNGPQSGVRKGAESGGRWSRLFGQTAGRSVQRTQCALQNDPRHFLRTGYLVNDPS